MCKCFGNKGIPQLVMQPIPRILKTADNTKNCKGEELII